MASEKSKGKSKKVGLLHCEGFSKILVAITWCAIGLVSPQLALEEMTLTMNEHE